MLEVCVGSESSSAVWSRMSQRVLLFSVVLPRSDIRTHSPKQQQGKNRRVDTIMDDTSNGELEWKFCNKQEVHYKHGNTNQYGLEIFI
jgi:hypothetical protein